MWELVIDSSFKLIWSEDAIVLNVWVLGEVDGGLLVLRVLSVVLE